MSMEVTTVMMWSIWNTSNRLVIFCLLITCPDIGLWLLTILKLYEVTGLQDSQLFRLFLDKSLADGICEKILSHWICAFTVSLIGQFQKISVPYHGRLPYFNSPLPSEFPKCIIPPCPWISIIVNPRPLRIFHFVVKPFGVTCRVC